MVSKPEKLDGKRHQRVDIYYNTIGLWTAPDPEGSGRSYKPCPGGAWTSISRISSMGMAVPFLRMTRPSGHTSGRIYGCYVNSQKEIVSYLDEPLDRMPEEEAEKYLTLLKKVLSGALSPAPAARRSGWGRCCGTRSPRRSSPARWCRRSTNS